jgi:hypothetical protein
LLFAVNLEVRSFHTASVDLSHRTLLHGNSAMNRSSRPLLAVHHVEMIAVKPTFAAYSTIDTVVVYETEDSDFADSAIDALKKDSP